MHPKRFPTKIDLSKMAETGFKWEGDLSIVDASTQLPTLYHYVQDLNQTATLSTDASTAPNPSILHLVCTLNLSDNHLPMLNAQCTGTLDVLCQRCLNPMLLAVDTTFEFALLTHEKQLDRLYSDQDYTMLDTNHAVPSKGFSFDVNLLSIVEEELLVHLPLAPKHEHCTFIAPEHWVEDISNLSDDEVPTNEDDLNRGDTHRPFSDLKDLLSKVKH